MNPTRGRDRTALAMRALLGLGALLLGLFVARALTGFGGASAQRLFATWVSDAICLGAVAVCLWRAAIEPRDRVMWGFAGLGMLAWSLGNAYWEHSLAAGVSLPNPSPADVGYLLFYPLVYCAVIAGRVLAVRRRHDDRPGIRLWLDGLIGAAACATVGAALVLEPVIADTAGESLAGALTNIAYPIGDLTLLAMLAVTTALVGWRGARGVALLAGGMALFALSDSLYLIENANGSYRPGGVLDAGWLLALMVMALGAVTLPRGPARAQDREAFPRERALVPSLAGLAALIVLGLQPLVAISTTGVVCAAITLALVLARLAFSLRETAQLLDERAHEARHDALTGLGNRRLLLADLERCAAEATPEHPTLLLLFDLDGFKVYNDTFGHNAGDRMLVDVAASLRDTLGARGRAYRIGGDEFCALLSIDGRHDAPARLGRELAHAMGRSGAGFAIAASHGGALAPADGRDTSALLRCADEAMYACKGHRRRSEVRASETLASGRRRPRGRERELVATEDPLVELEPDHRAEHDLLMGRWIREALAQERLVLHWQPIVQLASGRIAQHELLVRMLADDGDVIPPRAFIPTAERLGLIGEIDRWVTRRGLALAMGGRSVSINISAGSINEEEERILTAVREARAGGLRPDAVIFEITETTAMTNMQDARAFAVALRELGCEVALDDFGTGFGTFSYLKHLPTSYLKIDVEFVRELVSNATDRQLVRSLVEVGHNLGQRIIAEGVEDGATAQLLRELGVDLAQGYHFGAPAPVSARAPRAPAALAR
jgi:diguanylate cyclase (GGDEF)-like protein